MRFTKENVEEVVYQHLKETEDFVITDIVSDIYDMDDTPEKVVVPKFVADYLKERKRDKDGLFPSLYYFQDNFEDWSIKDWIEEEENIILFTKAWIDGYTIEPDTEAEQRYTVVIADRYLVLFIGRTDYRFVEFDELCAWKPSAFQLTEAEIKAIDKRYWTFAVPVKEDI